MNSLARLSPFPRRWFQFRLRTLLILVAVLAVPLAWLAHERSKVRERLDWLESLKEPGAFIEYKRGPPDQPAWLRTLLGDDSIADVVELSFGGDASDSELTHIAGLTQLRRLYLDNTQVTNAALVHLTGLTQLLSLDLSNTQVTDAGLVHLVGLTNLVGLNLMNTPVTAAGRQKLRQSLPNTQIYPDP